MEKNEARTLAYNLAKELNVNDLSEVAGGGIEICMVPTFCVSGMDKGIDTKPDVRVDQ